MAALWRGGIRLFAETFGLSSSRTSWWAQKVRRECIPAKVSSRARTFNAELSMFADIHGSHSTACPTSLSRTFLTFFSFPALLPAEGLAVEGESIM